jgi:peptidoglycan/xylan/chitin deacetylase (PgdA/CDA1 family)
MFSSGMTLRRIRKRSTDSLILTYHRIIPRHEAGDALQAGMYVSPETLEMHVQFLLKYFRVVSVFELSNTIRNEPNNSNHKPLCVLTFDDGWRDFYEYAFAVLRKFGVPATVFLPTDFIQTGTWFWTDRLGYLFYQRTKAGGRNEIEDHPSHPLVSRLLCLKGSLESRMEQAIEILKAYRTEEIENILSELSERWNVDQNPPGRAFLSWDEVREMRQSGLVSYGSHTATHRILTMLTKEEIREELIKSKEKLIAEKAVGKEYVPLCYPNGNYNEDIAAMAEEAGYALAVTTESGWNTNELNSFCLRRIPIHQDMTSTDAMFGCRITG